MRRRCARHHVAGVLLVTGRIGDDELALGGREIAIRHVDGDALLALGLEAVGEQRQIDFIADGALVLHPRQRRQLVRQYRLAVEQQPADQRALAVVDTARRDETQHAEVFGLMNAHDISLFLMTA